MKHIPTLPAALALLTLGGCATTNGLTTTEPDGIYYSSKDRTTEVAPVASADGDYAGVSDDPNAVANPDYQDGRTRTRGSASDEYYDDDFDYDYYARRRRYSGLGMNYGLGYVDPYWYRPTVAFYDPFFYSGYAPYGAYGYSAWNDPFYGGWGPYGSSISLSFGWNSWGYGSPWGPYGGYGYGYRPWGYGGYGYGGYGYGGYYNGFYDGYYSGLYGNGGYWNGFRNGGRSVNYRVAPRRDRSVEVVGANNGGSTSGGRGRMQENTGGRAIYDNGASNGSSGGTIGRYSRGRVENVGAATDGGGRQQADNGQGAQATTPGRGRMYRIVDNQAAPALTETNPTGGVRPGQQGSEQPQYQQPTRRQRFYNDQQPSLSTSGDAQPQMAEPQYTRPRRERYSDNSASQPQPQQYQQPTRRERTYEQPSYQQPTRSYEQPTRSYDGGGGRSYGGGNSGGGSSSGGSGGGGGRGRIR